MNKVGLSKGLIAYDTEYRIEQRQKGIEAPFHLLRPRSVYYACILALVGSIMLLALLTRAPVDLNVLHDRNPLFVQLSDGDIRNGYDLKILNKTHDDKEYTLKVEGISNAKIQINKGGNQDTENLKVGADQVGQFRVFIHAPAREKEAEKINFILTDPKTGFETSTKSMFISKRPKS
jgi:polyferredoxin